MRYIVKGHLCIHAFYTDPSKYVVKSRCIRIEIKDVVGIRLKQM